MGLCYLSEKGGVVLHEVRGGILSDGEGRAGGEIGLVFRDLRIGEFWIWDGGMKWAVAAVLLPDRRGEVVVRRDSENDDWES